MIGNERKGRLKNWDDAKGFGFIQPQDGGAEVFAHISVMRGDRRPQPGDEVLFIEGRDQRGRPRAEHLRLAAELSLDREAIRRKPKTSSKAAPAARKSAARSTHRSTTQGSIRNFAGKTMILALLCLLPVIGALQMFGNGLWWVLALYLLASLLSFLQYWLDKRSAQSGGQRTAENTLHLIELAGGWPGALVAQQTFRHKTRKLSYQAVFWLIIATHQLFWIDLLLLDGAYIARHIPSLVQQQACWQARWRWTVLSGYVGVRSPPVWREQPGHENNNENLRRRQRPATSCGLFSGAGPVPAGLLLWPCPSHGRGAIDPGRYARVGSLLPAGA